MRTARLREKVLCGVERSVARKPVRLARSAQCATTGGFTVGNHQILGIVLLAAGAVLLYFGYQASQSVGEQLVESFTGRFTDSTVWYFILGAAAAVGGVVLLVLRR
jgi:drug/metabolite transporter (DMT)-like permease